MPGNEAASCEAPSIPEYVLRGLRTLLDVDAPVGLVLVVADNSPSARVWDCGCGLFVRDACGPLSEKKLCGLKLVYDVARDMIGEPPSLAAPFLSVANTEKLGALVFIVETESVSF